MDCHYIKMPAELSVVPPDDHDDLKDKKYYELYPKVKAIRLVESRAVAFVLGAKKPRRSHDVL